jgi:transcription initiation protein SPT3
MASKTKIDGMTKDYKYATEISQMVFRTTQNLHWTLTIMFQMFVFGEVPEPNDETVSLVEDIVRGQIIELVSHSLINVCLTVLTYILQIVQARALASKRGLKFLTAEDLIFFIRHDRAKVNRLRTYLSWKEVRKHAKESTEVGPIEPDGVDEGPEGEG